MRASGERLPAAAAPRLDLAAAARDPRAARHPVRRRRARLRGARTERPGRARSARRARRARSRPTRASGPCSASTPTVVCDGARLRQAGDRARRRSEMLESARGQDARGRLRPLPAHAGLGGACTARSTRVTFRPLTAARPRALRRERRVGGARGRVRDPGPRRVARRADRGRLPERRRPAGGAARATAGGALRRRLRLRLDADTEPVLGTSQTQANGLIKEPLTGGQHRQTFTSVSERVIDLAQRFDDVVDAAERRSATVARRRQSVRRWLRAVPAAGRGRLYALMTSNSVRSTRQGRHRRRRRPGPPISRTT